MKNIKRKGFTLVELLIVIVVIGILSAMMMISSTEAVTSARASNIISNLRNFKTAAMAMYVDNYDKMDAGTNPDSDGTNTTLVKYMNKGSSGAKAEDDTQYYLLDYNNGEWYVKFTGNMDDRVKEKLAGRANSVAILGSMSQTDYYEKTDTHVYMFVTKASAGTTTNP